MALLKELKWLMDTWNQIQAKTNSMAQNDSCFFAFLQLRKNNMIW
jgi:hypothetical protein